MARFYDTPNGTVPLLASWSTPEKQLDQLRAEAPDDVPAEWFDIDVSRFQPHTPKAQPLAVLILPDKRGQGSVYRTFEFYVRLIRERVEGAGNSFWRWYGLQSDSQHLRLAPGVTHEPGLRIVSFDPTAHHEQENGHRVIDLWGSQTDLAGPEVLAALALTDYGMAMNGEDKPFMNLPGYQAKFGSDWSRYPVMGEWSEARNVYLFTRLDDQRSWCCSSPVVREC